MKHKITLFIFLITISLIIISGVSDLKSNGAPAASTNAPGELTCNRSPCHTGSPLNSGTGVLSIDIEDANGQYIPGKTYNINVSMEQEFIERFGFQTLVLFDNDTSNAGELNVTDEHRTKVVSGINQYAVRKYMTYKYIGTEPFAEGIGKWSFQWTAPQNPSGNITFYTAAASADNDGTEKGDLIYTLKHTLQPTEMSSISETKQEKLTTRIFPNPANDELNIVYETIEQGETSVYLKNILSQKSNLIFKREEKAGSHHFKMHLQGKYPSGVYLLTIKNGVSTDTHNLVIY